MGKLYLIGAGLTHELMTFKALKVVKEVRKVFIDKYTSILPGDGDELERIVGRELTPLLRRDLEERFSQVIIKELEKGDVAVLVPGDPLVATTHISLIVDVVKHGFRFEVIPGISIIPTALTMSGLMVYKIGKIATITYPYEGKLSEYPYDVIKENDRRNLHTILLLELDAEKDVAMRVGEAIDILFKIESVRREGVITPERLGIGIASLGSPTMSVCPLPLEKLRQCDIGDVPHTLILTSPKLHFMEEEALKVIRGEFCRMVCR
ncbi:MAG: diphthine synthase [Desulfurococcales archaeon]|nr:diphthine synthase [Desulfurococcales archaeon]